METVATGDRLPRIPPLEPPYDEVIAQRLAKMTPPAAPEPLALFRVMARNGVLAERASAFGAHFLGRRSTLSLRDRELVIDRVTARCGAEYEWGVHVAAFGAAAGFGEVEIRAITAGSGDAPLLTPRDRLLIRMVDELEASADVGDALWRELESTWNAEQLLELLVLTGWYRAISYVCNAARVPFEHWQRRFDAATLPHDRET